MKRYIKKIAVVLLAVMLFSAMANYAYASISQTYFSKYASYGTFVKIATQREKQDETPVYLNINNNHMTPTYFARVMGCDDNGNSPVNRTLLNGQDADYVTCIPGTDYGIDNKVFERGSRWVYVDIQANGVSSNTTGYWAPDSDEDKGYASPVM